MILNVNLLKERDHPSQEKKAGGCGLSRKPSWSSRRGSGSGELLPIKGRSSEAREGTPRSFSLFTLPVPSVREQPK